LSFPQAEGLLGIRRTKIVATLGPASSSALVVGSLLDAGMDVARLNASHGTPEQRAALIRTVRAAATEAGRPVATLLDLQGPRIRVGDLAVPVPLQPGQAVVFAPEGAATAGQIPTTFDLAADARPGKQILLDDGLIVVDVTAVRPPRVEGKVRYGGLLTSHKGINLPGVAVSVPPLTDKDRGDVAFAVEHDVDYIALSFVRRAEDLAVLRALLPAGLRIVAKIEKDTALDDIDRIAEAADAIMVARGDLGVELPFELVPLAQKRLIRVAIEHRRPVITATQMLESMVHSPRPTRAEASDVANAILDGTDAVMLSAETAAGEYPREAVEAMSRIIRAVEEDPSWKARLDRRAGEASGGSGGPARSEHAVAAAAVAAAAMLRAPIIVTFTKSGFSARVVAASRPPMPVLGVTDDERTYRQLALVWGVVPMLTAGPPRYDAMLDAARGRILDQALAKKGDRVVVTAGVPFDVPGTTNLVKVEEV
jgi:pyruvate kinase